MKVKRIADKELSKELARQLKDNGGHCPCVLPSKRSDDTLCICKEFREAPAGTVCHCGLYLKEEY